MIRSSSQVATNSKLRCSCNEIINSTSADYDTLTGNNEVIVSSAYNTKSCHVEIILSTDSVYIQNHWRSFVKSTALLDSDSMMHFARKD